MRRLLALLCATSLLAGCFDEQHPKPEDKRLRRAGASAPELPIPIGVKVPPPAPKTLYERLGREEGLHRVAEAALKEPDAKEVATKLTARRLGAYLMEATSADRPAEQLPVSAAEWDTLLTALRSALADQRTPDADRDELLTRLKKGKR
jgi:hypothetical protein